MADTLWDFVCLADHHIDDKKINKEMATFLHWRTNESHTNYECMGYGLGTLYRESADRKWRAIVWKFFTNSNVFLDFIMVLSKKLL